MNDFMFWFGFAANAVTLLAGAIAVAGVVWAISARGRLAFGLLVRPALNPSLSINVTSDGSNPIRNFELSYGSLDDYGFAMRGDGIAGPTTLNRGSSLYVFAFDRDTHSFTAAEQSGEHRVGLARGEGAYFTAQWQSPLFPWRRSSVTYAWYPYLRFASAQPKRLVGRAEREFLRRTRDTRRNSAASSFKASPSKARAEIATDATFEELASRHTGPILVALGASWQGETWEAGLRVLDAFAVKFGPKVKVIAVAADGNPKLAERYQSQEWPFFILLSGGTKQKTKTGLVSMPDLEDEFSSYLR